MCSVLLEMHYNWLYFQQWSNFIQHFYIIFISKKTRIMPLRRTWCVRTFCNFYFYLNCRFSQKKIMQYVSRKYNSRFAMVKASFNMKTLFISKSDSNLWRNKMLVKCYNWSVALYCADILERKSEITGNFWNVVLEKDVEDQLDWSCEKWRNITKRQTGEKYRIDNRKMK
jgi:hypothetical protein